MKILANFLSTIIIFNKLYYLWNCKLQTWIYVLNHFSAELNTVQMIHSVTSRNITMVIVRQRRYWVWRISVINFIRHAHGQKFPYYCDCVHNVPSIEHLCLYYNLYIYKELDGIESSVVRNIVYQLVVNIFFRAIFLLCLFIVIHLVMRCNKNVDI